VSPRDRLGVIRLPSSKPRILPGTDGVRDPTWSPDGRRIAFERTREVRVGFNEEVLHTLFVVDVRRPSARPRVVVTGIDLAWQWLRSGKLGFHRDVPNSDSIQVGVIGGGGGRITVIERAESVFP
jgi:WD40-like Beta Propeller Repeat